MSASAPAPHSASAPRRVLLAGATGLVGRELLRQLMADPTVGEVRALTRRPMSRGELLGRSGHRPGDERLQVCEVDFDRLDRHVALFEVDWVCCAMGTTIRRPVLRPLSARWTLTTRFTWPNWPARKGRIS